MAELDVTEVEPELERMPVRGGIVFFRAEASSAAVRRGAARAASARTATGDTEVFSGWAEEQRKRQKKKRTVHFFTSRWQRV